MQISIPMNFVVFLLFFCFLLSVDWDVFGLLGCFVWVFFFFSFFFLGGGCCWGFFLGGGLVFWVGFFCK